MRSSKKQWLVVGTFFFCLGLMHAQNNVLKKGNDQYKAKKYQEAEKTYQSSKDKDARMMYNLGNSLYKQEKYQEAIEAYQSATETGDSKTKARAHYNAGNAHFKINDFTKAVQAYKEAIKLDPKNDFAKENLIKAKIKLKEQQKQNNNQQNENQSDPQNQDQQSKNQEPNNKPQDQPNESTSNQSEQQQNKDEAKGGDEMKDNKSNAGLNRQLLNMIDKEDQKVNEKLGRKNRVVKRKKKTGRLIANHYFHCN